MQSPDTLCAQVPRWTTAQEEMQLLLSLLLRVQCIVRRQKSWSQPSPQTLSDSLSPSTQRLTEPCHGIHNMADDNRGRRSGSGKNQSPGVFSGQGAAGQQGPWTEMILGSKECEVGLRKFCP